MSWENGKHVVENAANHPALSHMSIEQHMSNASHAVHHFYTANHVADKVSAVGHELFVFAKETLPIVGHTIMDVIAQAAVFAGHVWQIVS